MSQKALLFDVTECVGCGECYTACKETNGLKPGIDDPLRDHLSAETYTVVNQYGEDMYSRKLCMHCLHPTCVSVCPVGAFEKTAEGPVLYDEDKCIGCRYCMQACPHHIPRYEWSSLYPKVTKCIMCSHRLKEGKETACAEVCPTGATKFGEREELIAEAKERIQENEGKYYPAVYGVDEGGGTCVLVLSPVPFDQLEFAANLPKEPLQNLTQAALDKIPTIVSVGTVFLGGMYWLTKRKNTIAKEEKQSKGKENDK